MIICAAIKPQIVRNGKPHETVIHGLRHANCWELMADMGIRATYEEVTEGFIDNQNRFLDRYDAFSHALECGQLPATVRECKREKGERQLYSEDLY